MLTQEATLQPSHISQINNSQSPRHHPNQTRHQTTQANPPHPTHTMLHSLQPRLPFHRRQRPNTRLQQTKQPTTIHLTTPTPHTTLSQRPTHLQIKSNTQLHRQAKHHRQTPLLTLRQPTRSLTLTNHLQAHNHRHQTTPHLNLRNQ